MKRVAIIGATGAVGREILDLLEKRDFDIGELHLFASQKSVGTSIQFRKKEMLIKRLEGNPFTSIDLAFFCAGSPISKQFAPLAIRSGSTVIDSSSAFRSDPDVPLVIPEINLNALKNHRGLISSPNCAATILLLPLAPLHRQFKIKRIVVSTYQAASGAGAHLLEELQNETRAYLENRAYSHSLPFPYAFNLYPHNSSLNKNGYVEEEIKIKEESRKILEDETIQVSATCVRVPVLRAHSISANVEFHLPFSLEQVYKMIDSAPGVKLFEERSENRFATPFDATGRNEVFCGRFRIDPSQANTLEFWAVGDQLLKGAALNAVQIAESISSSLFSRSELALSRPVK